MTPTDLELLGVKPVSWKLIHREGEIVFATQIEAMAEREKCGGFCVPTETKVTLDLLFEIAKQDGLIVVVEQRRIGSAASVRKFGQMDNWTEGSTPIEALSQALLKFKAKEVE